MMSNQESLFKELEKANKNIKKVIYSASTSIEKSVDELSKMGAEHVREMLSRPGTGKEYKYSYGKHRASAPGDPPAAQPGRPLHRSIFSEVTEKRKDGDKGRAVAIFGSRLMYARYLEYGWRRGASVGEPRPFMRPTAAWVAEKTPGVVAKNWIKARNAAIAKLPKTSNTGSNSVEYVGKMR